MLVGGDEYQGFSIIEKIVGIGMPYRDGFRPAGGRQQEDSGYFQ
jgi:hypothetical protein